MSTLPIWGEPSLSAAHERTTSRLHVRGGSHSVLTTLRRNRRSGADTFSRLHFFPLTHGEFKRKRQLNRPWRTLRHRVRPDSQTLQPRSISAQATNTHDSQRCRHRTKASISAFQAEDAGSIPVACSTLHSSAGESIVSCVRGAPLTPRLS